VPGERRQIRRGLRKADDRQRLAIGPGRKVLDCLLQIAAADDEAVGPFRLPIRSTANWQLEVAHDENHSLAQHARRRR
jgi:hypothetical protein